MNELVHIAALVPTFKRPMDLERCIGALREQSMPLSEIIVIVRDTDVESIFLVQKLSMLDDLLKMVVVDAPGQVHAINAGLQKVSASIVAITDDDAMPHRDWIARIASAFSVHPEVGGVGGRDNVHLGDVVICGERLVVGKIPRLGKVIGNHHLGAGGPRYVDMLKGVNGAYRTDLVRSIGLDPRLKGSGAQVHWEIGLALRIRAAGWLLWYDPAIEVEHYVAARHDEDQRNTFNALAVKNATYNLSLLRMERLTFIERIAYACWSLLIGTPDAPGIAQCMRFFPRQSKIMPRKSYASFAGVLAAWSDLQFRRVGRVQAAFETESVR